MKNILKYRAAIYAFLAIWIILLHTSYDFRIPINVPILKEFCQFGRLAVDIFLFLSGTCTYLSYNKKNLSAMQWVRKHWCKIFVPYIFVISGYSLSLSVLKNRNFSFSTLLGYCYNWICDVSSYKFWTGSDGNFWFIYAILFCYLLVPFLYKLLCKDNWKRTFLCIIVGLHIAIIICYFYEFQIIKNFVVMLARIPIFIIGMISGKLINHPKIQEFMNKKSVLILSSAILFLSIYCFNNVDKNYYIFLYFLNEILTISFLVLANYIIQLITKVNISFCNKLISSVGGLSLELYLIHSYILTICDVYKFIYAYTGYFYYLLIICTSVLFSFLLNLIIGKLSKLKGNNLGTVINRS